MVLAISYGYSMSGQESGYNLAQLSFRIYVMIKRKIIRLRSLVLPCGQWWSLLVRFLIPLRYVI